MNFLSKVFGIKESFSFIELHTHFKLSSKESIRFKGPFQCRLLKKVKFKGNFGYLVELDQTFSGVDFGVGAIAINKFFLIPKYFGKFGEEAENDVLILLPKDLTSDASWDESNILAWGYIFDLEK